MDSARRLLLEDPMPIYVVLAVTELALAAWWHARRTRALTVAMVFPPLLAVAVAMTAHLVQTDREKIAAAMRTVADALEARDVDAIAPYLDKRAAGVRRGSPLNREELVEVARAAMRRWSIREIRLTDVQTTLSGHSAATSFKAQVRLGDYGVVPTAWRLRWAKTADGRWLIDQVENTGPAMLHDLNP